MSDPSQKPLFEEVRAEIAALGRELREMMAARWELARLELSADLRSLRRLAVCWLLAALVAMTVLPVLAVALAHALAGIGNIGFAGWLLLVAGGLLLAAAVGVWAAWRRFRRKFVGLRETLEELREDMTWLAEKTDRDA
ncbi:MAG: phage holin family protein [Thermoguttaceae bacterium]